MIEKRTFPRLPRDWEIEYQSSPALSVQPILSKGGLRDFGAGGFRFTSELVHSPEALFQFSIKPTDNFRPMVGVARIAWSRREERAYEYGAEFVWVSWKGMDAQTAIAHYVLDNLFTRPS